ncbi:MAG TPA: alpha/beta hydrolase [Micromonosporaceae bacterium]
MTSAPIDETCVLVDGDWTHRLVSANGTRLHVAEAGAGPLVLFLHGFPEFWAAWQHQLAVLAGAGFRAVAVDLRGYGASDKPPRGYDGYTQTADVTGLIRALGERSAILVGTGYGGLLAWSTAALFPRYVHRLVVLAAAHPLRLRSAVFAEPRSQLAAAGPVMKFQLPRYEHVLTSHDAARVGAYLRQWAGPGWVDSADFETYERWCRTAYQIPQVAFCSLESFRWGVRSMLRLRGHRFRRQLRAPVVAPTLHLHGAEDRVVLPSTAQGSGRYVIAPYEWRLLDGVGHFPHREAPDLIAGEILRWAKE